MWLVKILILFFTFGSLFFIFFDYHKKTNIEKAVLFAALVVAGGFTLFVLVDLLGFGLLYLLPIFAFLPFAIALFTRKK